MKTKFWAPVAWGGLTLLLAIAGCQRSAPVVVEEPEPAVLLGETRYRITGPYEHENLALYLLHTDHQEDGEYLTLDQGLKDGVVTVSEKAEGEVRALLIDNQSEKPLFLQEGDRVQGGKQDRTLYSSLVIPPKSGPMPIPTFCIEQGRWAAGERGVAFASTENAALAPKEVRQAAKVNKNQAEVWLTVEEAKKNAAGQLQAPNTNSSLNEALDAPAIKKLSDACAEALSSALASHPDAVGVAIVVNGNVEEVNVYPNHQLLGKLYPRLLQSYAVQAALQKEAAKDAPTCTARDVARFMTEGKERKAQPAEQLDALNRLSVECIDDKKFQCSTEYAGQAVHQQFMRKSELPGRANGAPTVQPRNDKQAPGQGGQAPQQREQ